jgi:hypothetical protein
MGYKGIITSYLPRNHTVVKTVEAKGATEAKYNERSQAGHFPLSKGA